MSEHSDRVGAEAQLRTIVGRVGARMRWAAAVRASVRVAWPLGLALIAVVAAARLNVLAHAPALGLGAAVVSLALVAVAVAARPVPASAAAAAADRELQLHDRLSSALAFCGEARPSPLMRLAIADGARAGATVDPRAVVVLRVPRSARGLPLLAMALVLIAAVHLPRPKTSAPVPPAKPRLVVEKDALDAERAAVRGLAVDAGGKDPRLAALARELDALLHDIDQQKLSRAEAFAKLAALESGLERDRAAAPPKPTAELAALQKAFAQHKVTQALAAALKADDLDQARKELEQLAAAAEKNAAEKPAAERELAEAMERASRALDEARKKEEAERERKIEELKEEERRLRKEKSERPDDEEVERRLQRNQRELERLERERQAAQEQRRQLERLSRELQKAAEELRKKMSPEAMRRAAEQLGKMEDEIRKLGSGGQAQMQIAELKEVLRRAGRSQSGAGGQQQGQAQGPGQGQGQGKGDGRDERLAEFDERAGGQPNALVLGGDDPGKSSVMLPLPMGGGGGEPNGPGKDQRGENGGETGGGIGHEHDPNLVGDPTRAEARHKLIHAKGQQGQGPSRSQTILGAAERGFSGRDYGKVYKDYSQVVEEVMSQEGVPPGYRYYIKRYFQLIRPRE